MFRPLLIATIATLPVIGTALAIEDAEPEQGPISRTISVEQMPLHAVSTSVQSIAVNAVLDRPTGTYEIGEPVGLSVSVSQPSYLTVFNVGPDGQTTVLFPNRFNRDSRVEAERTIPVPGPGARLIARAPAGIEMIKVVASAHPIDIASLADFRNIDGFETSGPRSADAVARSLGVVAALGVASGAGAWGEAVLTIKTQMTKPVVFPVQPITLQPIDDEFSLRIEPAKPAFRVGEPIALDVHASERCTLTILSFGPSGAVDTVIPTGATGTQVLEAGQKMRIAGTPGSGAFIATAPVGTETIRAFCAKADEPVFDTRVASNKLTGDTLTDASVAGDGTLNVRDIQVHPVLTPRRPAARIAEAITRFDVVD